MQIIYPISEVLPDYRARFIQIVHTAHALAAAGCRVDLIFGRGGASNETVLRFYGLKPQANLHLHPLPVWRPGPAARIRLSWNGVFFAGAAARIRTVSGKNRSGILYLRHVKLAAFLSAWRFWHRLPFVFEAHELFHETAERSGKKHKLKKMEEKVYRSARVVFPLTEALQQRIVDRFRPPGRLAVLPSGVDLDWPPPPAGWGHEKSMVYVGSLYAWKGVETAVEALRFLPEGTLEVIGGDPEGRKRLRGFARDREVDSRLHLHRPVSPDRVRGFFFKGTVAVLPSTRGPYAESTSPLKLFEYLAAGLPVVASDIPAYAGILRDGINALLVPPEEPRALAAAAERLFADRDLRRRLSAAGRETVRDYSWASRAMTIIRVLEEELGKRCGE